MPSKPKQQPDEEMDILETLYPEDDLAESEEPKTEKPDRMCVRCNIKLRSNCKADICWNCRTSPKAKPANPTAAAPAAVPRPAAVRAPTPVPTRELVEDLTLLFLASACLDTLHARKAPATR